MKNFFHTLHRWFASVTRTHEERVCNAQSYAKRVTNALLSPFALQTQTSITQIQTSFKILFLLVPTLSFAQTQPFTLSEVVKLAKAQSIAAKQAATRRNTNYWQYRSFIADFKPQLSLNGTLPGFTRSFIEVVQPDGTISFQPVSNNNSSLNMALSQNIALTGGTVFVQQQLQRFDDFARNKTRYNGIPFAIGVSQPLFRFNDMKWNRKIEPLKFQEGNQKYLGSLEEVALNATGYYFDLLIAQVNLQIAEKNRSNNDTLFKIAKHKLEMGKISQNDLLQLQIGLLTAQKGLASAQQAAADLTDGESRIVKTNGVETYKIRRSHFMDQGFRRSLLMIEELTVELLESEKKAYGKVIRMMAHEVNNTLGATDSILPPPAIS